MNTILCIMAGAAFAFAFNSCRTKGIQFYLVGIAALVCALVSR